MITRLYLATLCSILLLLPAIGWTLDEASGTAAVTTAPETHTPPAQSAPVQSLPAKPAATTVAPSTPAPAAATPAKPATAQSIPAASAPAVAAPTKPVPAQATPAKPEVAVPAKPAAVTTKPAIAPPIPPTPIPAPAVRAKPGNTSSPPALPASAPQELFPSSDTATHTADIEVFIREGCLNCNKAAEFLHKLHNLQPHLTINIRDIRKEPAALVLLKRVAQNQGENILDYPAFVVGGHLIMGFTDEANTAQLILDNLPLSHATGQENEGTACKSGTEPGCALIPAEPPAKPEKMTINLFGHSIPVAQIGLPLFTVAMGILDGLNHGSTWVLLLMVSLLAPMKNRTLMFSIAGTFIAVKGLIYLILLVAWFNLSLAVGFSRISQMIFSALAFIAGVIYLKNYLQYGQRITQTVHEIAKPGIYTQIRKIVQSESLPAALLGTVLLSGYVQLGELTFTSVFPALYTRILSLHHLDQLSNFGYLLLYNFAYMLDDIIVLGIGIFTFNHRQVVERKESLLILISALTLLGVAVYMMLMNP